MNNMKVKIEEDIINYICKLQCLNKNCKYNFESVFCNLKNIIINKNGKCFNYDKKEYNETNERLDRK